MIIAECQQEYISSREFMTYYDFFFLLRSNFRNNPNIMADSVILGKRLCEINKRDYSDMVERAKGTLHSYISREIDRDSINR